MNGCSAWAPDADPQAVFDSAVRKANRHDWYVDFPSEYCSFYASYASRTVDGIRASLTIGVTDINGPWELAVFLSERS